MKSASGKSIASTVAPSWSLRGASRPFDMAQDRLRNPVAHGKRFLRQPLLLILGVLSLAAAPAFAQSFPEKGKAVNFIVASPAGSGSDISARLLVPHLEKHLGTPVRIINRPGAGGQI